MAGAKQFKTQTATHCAYDAYTSTVKLNPNPCCIARIPLQLSSALETLHGLPVYSDVGPSRARISGPMQG